jgi:hypothetical protein
MYAGPTIMLLRQYSPHDVQPVVASAHTATSRQTAWRCNERMIAWLVTNDSPDQGSRLGRPVAGLLQGLKKRRFTAEIVQFATSP